MICIHFWQSFLQSLIFRLAGLLQVKQHISRNTAASILKASDRLFFKIIIQQNVLFFKTFGFYLLLFTMRKDWSYV